MHFSLKIWHLVASNILIVLKINSRSRKVIKCEHKNSCLSNYWSGSRRVCSYDPRRCSVAMHSKYGEIFNDNFIANVLQSEELPERSSHNPLTYGEDVDESTASPFYGSRCTTNCIACNYIRSNYAHLLFFHLCRWHIVLTRRVCWFVTGSLVCDQDIKTNPIFLKCGTKRQQKTIYLRLKPKLGQICKLMFKWTRSLSNASI